MQRKYNSLCNSLIFNSLQFGVCLLAVFLHIFDFFVVPAQVKERATARYQPSCRNLIITNEIFKPSHLKYISFGRLLAGVEVPTVYAVAFRKGLLAAYDFVRLQYLNSLKEATNYFLTLFCLHNSSCLLYAAANRSFICSSRSASSCDQRSTVAASNSLLPS